LQELLKRLQEKHGKCVEALTKKAAADAQAAAAAHAPDVIQVMMLLQKARFRAKAEQDRAKAAQDQAKVANKVVVEAEKAQQRCCSKRSARAATADGTKESSNKCYNFQ